MYFEYGGEATVRAILCLLTGKTKGKYLLRGKVHVAWDLPGRKGKVDKEGSTGLRTLGEFSTNVPLLRPRCEDWNVGPFCPPL